MSPHAIIDLIPQKLHKSSTTGIALQHVPHPTFTGVVYSEQNSLTLKNEGNLLEIGIRIIFN
jgi:hypothetical protein